MPEIQVFCACGEESILVAPDDPAGQVRLSLAYARWKYRHNGEECQEVNVQTFDAMGYGPQRGRRQEGNLLLPIVRL